MIVQSVNIAAVSSLPEGAAPDRDLRCSAFEHGGRHHGHGHRWSAGTLGLSYLIRCCVVLVLMSEQVDEEQKPMSYSQTFQLLREGESYYVFNDMFRLIYPA